MVLKINNNLITPSHILEGEKVNDTYFEGKYHLMLPNSEERYLTSVSERKQLLNESLRSNLYDRKTKRTIVSNTTSGKMFDEYIVSEDFVTISNFTSYNYVVSKNSFATSNANSLDLLIKFKISSNSVRGILFGTIGRSDRYKNIQLYVNNGKIEIAMSSNGVSWDIAAGNYSILYTPNIMSIFKLSYNGQNYKISISEDDGNTWLREVTIQKSEKIKEMSFPSFCVGGTEDNDKAYLSNAELEISSTKTIIDNIIVFDGNDKNQYDIIGSPTIKKETITTRTVTQKPFNQSVTINSSEIQEGTKYLVDYPGMFQLKTEDNTLAVKFLFEDEPVWKYIKQEELVEGDNVLSLVSDTEKLKFIVNTTEHILVDSTLTEEVRCFINNSTENNYWQLVNPFNPGENEWEISFDFYSGTGGRNAQGIFINEVSNQYGTRIGMSNGYFSFLNGNGSWINTSSYYGGDRIEDNKLYHVQAGYKNNNYYIKHSFDGNEYKTDVFYNSSRKISSVKSKIGTIYNASGVKFYIDTLKIIVGNEVVFDGKTAVQGVDYTVVGSPTIETEIIHIGGEIPELTAGYLGYREGWV